MQDLPGRQVDLVFETPVIALQYVKEGRLRALAICSGIAGALQDKAFAARMAALGIQLDTL